MSEESTQQVNQELTTPSEPIEKFGGDSTTWDDLEALTTAPKEEKTEKKETKKGDQDEKESSKEESKKSSKEVNSEKEKESEKKETQTPPLKMLRLKNGDQEVELRADSLVDVKVNGKVEKISLQDVLNGYSGQSHLNKEYQKFSKEKKEFDAQRGLVNATLKSFFDKIVSNGDVRGAIWDASELLGQNPGENWEKVSTKMREQQESLLAMTPEERAIRDKEEENKFYKTREAERLTKAEQAKRDQAFVDEALQLMDKNGINDAEFHEAYTKIFNAIKQSSGNTSEIKPSDVVRYIQIVKVRTQAEEMLSEVLPMEDTAYASSLETLRERMLDPKYADVPKEEWSRYILEVFGGEKAKRLNNKIKRLESKAVKHTPVKSPANDVSFFGDLDG
jgi:hypothetical protein